MQLVVMSLFLALSTALRYSENETMQLVVTFLFLAVSNALRNSGNNETIQHGACLGIGLAGMATGNEELYEDCESRV